MKNNVHLRTWFLVICFRTDLATRAKNIFPSQLENQTVFLFQENKKLSCHALGRLSDSTKVGGVPGPLRLVCAVVILDVQRDQWCEVWKHREEWTQTKALAWWKRRWGWQNVRQRYKTENMFVLAISNHWFEMSWSSKERNKPSLQVLLHQNATMNFSPFLSIARHLYCLGNDPDHSIGTR